MHVNFFRFLYSACTNEIRFYSGHCVYRGIIFFIKILLHGRPCLTDSRSQWSNMVSRKAQNHSATQCRSQPKIRRRPTYDQLAISRSDPQDQHSVAERFCGVRVDPQPYTFFYLCFAISLKNRMIFLNFFNFFITIHGWFLDEVYKFSIAPRNKGGVFQGRSLLQNGYLKKNRRKPF